MNPCMHCGSVINVRKDNSAQCAYRTDCADRIRNRIAKDEMKLERLEAIMKREIEAVVKMEGKD